MQQKGARHQLCKQQRLQSIRDVEAHSNATMTLLPIILRAPWVIHSCLERCYTIFGIQLREFPIPAVAATSTDADISKSLISGFFYKFSDFSDCVGTLFNHC